MTAIASRPRGRTGVRVELARYVVSAGERVLFGQRVDGVVRVTDVPADAGGRAYLVERGLEQEGSNANAALEALIADYLQQARRLDAIPMAENPIKEQCSISHREGQRFRYPRAKQDRFRVRSKGSS